MSLAVKNGRLVEVYPVYGDEKECEACSSGGQREFIFQWDGSRFVLEDVIDVSEPSVHQTKFSAGVLAAFLHVPDESLFRSCGRECDAATAIAALVLVATERRDSGSRTVSG
jgi:hypothetical protein